MDNVPFADFAKPGVKVKIEIECLTAEYAQGVVVVRGVVKSGDLSLWSGIQ
jgi:hypothetical protein